MKNTLITILTALLLAYAPSILAQQEDPLSPNWNKFQQAARDLSGHRVIKPIGRNTSAFDKRYKQFTEHYRSS